MARILTALAALVALVTNVTLGCSSGLHCGHGGGSSACHAHAVGCVSHHHHGHHRRSASPEHDHDSVDGTGTGHESPADHDHHPGDHWQFVLKLPQTLDGPSLPTPDDALVAAPAPRVVGPIRTASSFGRVVRWSVPDRPIMLRVLLL